MMITLTPVLAKPSAPALSRGNHATASMAADRFESRFRGDGSLGPPLSDTSAVRDLAEQFREFAGKSNVGKMLWALAQLKKEAGESVAEVQSRWIRELWEEDGFIDQIKRGQFLERVLEKPDTLLPAAQETLVRCVWEQGTDVEKTTLEGSHSKLDFTANQLSHDYAQQQAAPIVAQVEGVLGDTQAWLARQQASLDADLAVLRGSKKS